jgi:hypothetical protein
MHRVPRLRDCTNSRRHDECADRTREDENDAQLEK